MNIYLIAYTRNNLGDDLFTSMLVSRYPYVNFDINIEEIKYAESLSRFNNVNILNKKMDLNKLDINKYDAIVYIGGSIFMEKFNGLEKLKQLNKFIKLSKKNEIPFFYISSNFGPYSTQEYLDLARDTLKNCEDICFRDKYSYELFKDIRSVRYAPDLILSYDFKKGRQKKNTVGISVIDLSIRDELKNLENKYLEMLKNNIHNYQKEGKTVYLFSFCAYEGDEKTIEKVERLVKDKEKLKIIKYDGKIKDFLEIYSQMEYMICTRFHSMILSTKLEQEILVLSYSKKIDNVIKDLEFPFYIETFENLNENKILSLENFKIVEKEKLDKLAVIAESQFERLDNFIKNRELI